MRHLVIVVLGVMVMSLLSCGGDGTAVPRRTAYPRVAVYDSVYAFADELPIVMKFNAGAEVESTVKTDGAVWINVRYPLYDAIVYCTLTPVDSASVESVIDNRTERMHRNLGNATPQIEDIDSEGGYSTKLVITPNVATTPIQFIAVNVDLPQWVVSGSVFFDNATSITSIDSVKPIIDVMARDIRVMLNSLADK